MKHLIAIPLAAIAAVMLLWLTNRSGSFHFPGSEDLVRVDHSTPIDESAEPAAKLMQPADPGQRREIATMLQQTAAMDDSQWTKSFSLTDSTGKTVTSEDLKGEPYIANFFFSTCPGSCKQQTDQLRLLQDKYADLPVRLVSISVDPQVDSPEVLAAYADAAGAIPGKWIFLTGDMKQISKIGSELFLVGGIKERGHPDRFCLVAANRVLIGKYDWHQADELAALDQHLKELISVSDLSLQP